MTIDETAFLHYGLTSVLACAGFHGLFYQDHLVKKILSFNLLQAGIILFALSLGQVLPKPSAQLNPLPHALAFMILAASLAVTLVLLSLAFALYRRYHTFSLKEISKRTGE
jgi:multisubunit Na+/H+ antiporter MnhC subunit